jgi:hypothetical protein
VWEVRGECSNASPSAQGRRTPDNGAGNGGANSRAWRPRRRFLGHLASVDEPDFESKFWHIQLRFGSRVLQQSCWP